MEGVLLETLEGVNPADTSALDLWPPELLEVTLLLFEAVKFVVTCCGGPRKRIEILEERTEVRKSSQSPGILGRSLNASEL